MKYIIDAANKKIGRVASQAASYLLGKKDITFAKNIVSDTTVEIINTDRADITARKKLSDIYVTYTGHRGGLKQEILGELINRRGLGEVFYRAIYRMLPDNKLRDRRMKNLIIKS
ncbi:MAG: hypothetical protein A3B11_01800 [Candidatus Taylorbacteria bacterium RIFCSPLOWO2_01_FULL_44_26]|uniref:50S ribosomal protein L13 n=2 Tax=Candidatus Tayloriibacteriota TaxID=1817919 RepID=A0A1G2MJE4_9BACT|nr:MAG: hypothetical protein A3D50_02095 [Candidatus Taylorbacteria bacterium RIFCSPHIGHO2_02_FULL_44_12]OHA31407.1 MAG: hypothetical protein A3B11_01800 [Candidatus Taylorbacteria bacterium RIFCSPLOWO2_01_FULL_44_26]